MIFGIALAWLGAGEAPAPSVLAGGALVIGALVFNEWLGLRDRRAAAVAAAGDPVASGLSPISRPRPGAFKTLHSKREIRCDFPPSCWPPWRLRHFGRLGPGVGQHPRARPHRGGAAGAALRGRAGATRRLRLGAGQLAMATERLWLARGLLGARAAGLCLCAGPLGACGWRLALGRAQLAACRTACLPGRSPRRTTTGTTIVMAIAAMTAHATAATTARRGRPRRGTAERSTPGAGQGRATFQTLLTPSPVLSPALVSLAQ